MARVVLLHFDEDTIANRVVQAVEDGDTISFYGLKGDVIGIFMIPTKFCSCVAFSGPAYGTKFGLRICRACGLPEKESWQWPKNLYGKAKDFGIKWYFSYVTGGKGLPGRREQ